MGCLGSSLVILVAFWGCRGLWAASVFGNQAQKDPRNFSQDEVLGELTYLGKARKGRFFSVSHFSMVLAGFWQMANWRAEIWSCARWSYLSHIPGEVHCPMFSKKTLGLSGAAAAFLSGTGSFFFHQIPQMLFFSRSLPLSLRDLMAIIEFVKYIWFFLQTLLVFVQSWQQFQKTKGCPCKWITFVLSISYVLGSLKD